MPLSDFLSLSISNNVELFGRCYMNGRMHCQLKK